MNPSKTSPRGHRMFSVALLSLVTTVACSQGIPEPGLVLYGQVRNAATGNSLLTYGTLRWTLAAKSKLRKVRQSPHPS